ncbi:MAG TPA: tetratricopeptide repeat protein, partial [Fimbriiglobus sp.]|nr:tetratricopeptide repeat protein [Fimbriiglobus sp.]
VVLAVQTDPRLRREALDAFERIEARQPLAPDDQFLYARLLASVGEWPKARVRLGNLVRSNGANLFYTSYYGFAVLQYDGDTREARTCLEVMAKAQPDSRQTVELKARVLEAEGRRDEAAAVVEGYLARDADRLAFAAQLLERLGMADRAEPLYRKLALDNGQPGAILALASFLGRQGKTGDALSTVRGVIGKVSPAAVAAVGVEVLYHAPRVEPADARQVETWIDAAATKEQDGKRFLGLTAIVRMAQGRYAEAIRLYREVVTGDRPDPLAMNNLGYLLATHEQRYDEALEWVTKAKEAAGPLPTFVDTEALILIRKGEAQRAVDLLADLTRESPRPAEFYHLALAHQALGNRVGQSAAVRQAKRWMIRPIDVPPIERDQLARVLKEVR